MKRKIKNIVKYILQLILIKSINRACKNKGLSKIREKLIATVPNISDSRTNYEVNSPYLQTAFRTMDAFQIKLFSDLHNYVKIKSVVDIGDSDGRHSIYIKELFNENIYTVSVNLDEKAISKIRSKGLIAIHDRAENINKHIEDIEAGICFETLEHITDPITTLHTIAEDTSIEYLVITVPYMKNSRVALQHIRKERIDKVHAENVHIFEFCPNDWELVFKHSGWKVLKSEIYREFSYFNPLKFFLKLITHEGFMGYILVKDNKYSSLYNDW